MLRHTTTLKRLTCIRNLDSDHHARPRSPSRRSPTYSLRTAALTALLVTSVLLAFPAHADDADGLRIGIIGTGNVGGALARHWANAGHEILMSSRNPDQLVPLADELGPRARVGTPREAAAFGEVILVAVPYAATPQIGRDYATELAGKIVLDAGNPIERRDGPMAAEVLHRGTGFASAEFLTGTRLVRAFNCIPAASLRDEANREPPIAIPLAGDDAEAIAMAERLVRDAGFDPVVIGGLDSAHLFDLGQPLAQGNISAEEMRARRASLERSRPD
jgi:8-hydroxy-5-deazaflavin:NADPH oxidoreductase